MKTTVVIIALLFMSISGQSQNWLSGLKLQSYAIPTRPVYFKYFADNNRMIYLDFKEGLSVPCVAYPASSAKDSTSKNSPIEFFSGEQWHFKDNIQPDLVYIPTDQDIDNWNEMITFQRIDSQGQKAQKLYEDLVKIREENCLGKSQFEIIESSKNSLIYQVSSEQCEEFEPQTALAIIITPPKLTIGQYTIWRVEYTIKDANQFDKFTPEVISWFKSIELLTGKSLKDYTE